MIDCASNPVERTHALRRGWCPQGRRVMWAADGALIRLRVPGARLTMTALGVLLPIVRRYSAGGLLLTRRAKIELRGVADPDAALEALADAGWLETADRARLPDRVVLDDPGHAPQARALHDRLGDRLAGLADLNQLPDKFLIVIDDGGRLAHAALAADIRLDAVDATHWRVALAGDRATATPLVTTSADGAIDTTVRLIAALIARTPGTRYRDLSAADYHALTEHLAAPYSTDEPVIERPATIGVGLQPDLGWVVRFVFGALPGDALAELLAACGDAPINLLADRRLVLSALTPAARARLRAHGAIDDDRDPRNMLTACIGNRGCSQATTDTRADALTIAARWPELARAGLHVSGCAKGCAGRDARAITLVGRDTRYDLVRRGTPADRALVRGLAPEALGGLDG